jgi:hypothetical protein
MRNEMDDERQPTGILDVYGSPIFKAKNPVGFTGNPPPPPAPPAPPPMSVIYEGIRVGENK